MNAKQPWATTSGKGFQYRGLCKLIGGSAVLAVSLMVIGSSVPQAAPAAVDGLTIPSAHPRLWWTPARVTQAQQWYTSHPFNPPSDGTSVEYVSRAAKYVMTGDASVCQPAVNWAATNTPSDWNSSTQSDGVRWNGEGVALVYDWCYPLWTAAQRQTAITNWNQYISFNMTNTNWGYLNMPANNYFWGNFRNAFEWGVATYGDNASAQSFIDHALNSRWPTFLSYAAGADKGGVFPEGSGYGMYMARYAIVPLQSSSLYGRNINAETNFYREAVMNMIYQTTPAPTAGKRLSGPAYQVLAFNDDQFFDTTNYDNNFPNFMATMAQMFSGVPIGQYARQWLSNTGNTPDEWIQATDNGGTALSFSNLPLDYVAPGTGQLFARTGWGTTGTYIQVQGGAGSGLGHWHADYGNFHIWRNGYWLTKESTGYSDTFTGWGGAGGVDSDQAPGHNVMFYNGQGPIHEYPQAVTAIRRLETTPNYTYMVSDLSQAMHSGDSRYDNPSAGTTIREYLFLKPLETVILLDRMTSTTSTTKAGIAIHFENTPTISGTKIVGVNGNQALEVNSILPASPTVRVIDEGTAGRPRLELESSGQTLTYFLTVLQARDASAAGLTITSAQDANTVTLTLQNATGSAKIVFTKGAQSTGGQLGYAATQTIPSTLSPLATGVRGILVTDSGVSWSNSSSGTAPAAPTGVRIISGS